MAQPVLSKSDISLINEALIVYGGEVGKLMKKAEKLNLKQAPDLKQQYLDVAALRERLTRNAD